MSKYRIEIEIAYGEAATAQEANSLALTALETIFDENKTPVSRLEIDFEPGARVKIFPERSPLARGGYVGGPVKLSDQDVRLLNDLSKQGSNITVT